MRFLLLLPFILILSCQTSKSDKEDLKALKDEVFEIHDEVMPKMGTLSRMRKDLVLQADSLVKTDRQRASELLEASYELSAANESMMNWMRNFDPNFEGNVEETMQYLTDQKASITVVKEKMLKSLEAGSRLLEKGS